MHDSVFTWVLRYLRLEQQLYELPPADMIRSVRMEADFWGLKDLFDILDANHGFGAHRGQRTPVPEQTWRAVHI